MPDIPDLPAVPPAAGAGRLLLDANGPAKISRVTETIETREVPLGYRYGTRARSTVLVDGRKTELLCIAPCAVDLPTGAHSLVFTSTSDQYRSSTVDVAVPKGTTVVRHAIGYERPGSFGYLAGAIMILHGAGLTLLGGVLTTFGAAGRRTVDKEGRVDDPRELLPFGIISGVLGIALVTTGIVLMQNNRPVRQAGVTTQFRRE